jgi:hypothetical protein
VRNSLVNISVIFSSALINCFEWPHWLGSWMFFHRFFTRKNIGVLIFDLVLWVVTKGVRPLLEYPCFRTWYHSTFEEPSHSRLRL